MYANLKVTTQKGKQMMAWKVEFFGKNRAKVFLDGQNGTGKYAEPKGVVVVGCTGMTIEADF